MIDPAELMRRVSSDAARLAEAPRRESVEDWVALAGACQELLSRVQAVQTVAVANVSSIEDVVDSRTGEVVEQFRGYDHHRMDAPALVCDVLGVTPQGAESRVGLAAKLAARYPVVLEAMGQGRIDAYRAGIIESELRGAPDAAVEAVLSRIEPDLRSEPGGRLRQRVRRALGQVAEEFLRQKAVQARKDRSLQRMAGEEPGVDTWVASLPVEASGKAWAAINALARQYVAAGECATIDQARADAMLAYIDGNARAEYVLQVAVPASQLEPTPADLIDRPVDAAMPAVEMAERPAGTADGHGSPDVALAEWVRKVLERPGAAQASDAERGRRAPSVGVQPLVPRRVRVDVLPCDETTGAYTSTPVGSWTISPRSGGAGVSPGGSGASSAFTGAIVRQCATPDAVVTAYRPTGAMIRTVKGRDGQCRFPGCTVAAVFCDLDHVIPWVPDTPSLTRVGNLICLCRRHHRTKQLRRWRVRMSADGTVTWTDPTGRQRTTTPINHLHPDPVPWLDDHGRAIAADGADIDTTGPVELPSLLEERLGYHLDRRRAHGPPHHRLTTRDGLPIGTVVRPGRLCTVELDEGPLVGHGSRPGPGGRRGRGQRARPTDGDRPPF